MHRFFLTDHALAAGAEVDLGAIRHQLGRVLRSQPGDTILLLNGDGQEYVTELSAITESGAIGVVRQARAATGEPRLQVTLYQCALKGGKMEWVLQKGTELGVSRFVPVISERTIVRPASRISRKYDRWRTILREAAEQSRRGLLPVLADPMSWSEAVQAATAGGALRLFPWEAAGGALGLAQAVTASGVRPKPRLACLLVGPEGGLSDAEARLALSNGWQLVTLGSRILRAETAALSALAILMSASGEME
jgi:16S rRNA (uracil1498-N3)-methyltransferase